MKKSYLIFLFCVVGFIGLQAQDVILESTGPVRESRVLDEKISNIKTFQNVNVFVSQSDTAGVTIEVGHVDLFRKVKTDIVGDTLIVSVDEIYYTNKLYEHPVNVFVSFKKLSSIQANTKSKVNVVTEIETDVLSLQTNTGAFVKFEKGIQVNRLNILSNLRSRIAGKQVFKVDNAVLTVGTKASVDLNIEATVSLECYVTNESTVDLKGSAQSVLVTSQDKSSIKMKDFTCEFANAFATAEAYINIIPKNTLTATATYKAEIVTSKKVKNIIKSESTRGRVRL